MIPSAVILLQARLGSSRLPGKALRRIAGRTLLAHCLDRLRLAGVAPVYLATTTNPEDDLLEREAARRGVRTIRGPADDVLGRFVLASAMLSARYVVRATADNPAVDIDAPGRVLRALAGSTADYVGECGLPLGAAVEAIRVEALREAGRAATRPDDREHVTTFLKRERRRFLVHEMEAPAALQRPDLRLTVDTARDLHFMDAVLSRTGAAADAPLSAIIRAADQVLAEGAAA